MGRGQSQRRPCGALATTRAQAHSASAAFRFSGAVSSPNFAAQRESSSADAGDAPRGLGTPDRSWKLPAVSFHRKPSSTKNIVSAAPSTTCPSGRNSERTPDNDYKLDLRFSKTVAIGRVRLQGILEGFNILNTENLTSYNGLFGSNTYLQPASSTEIFYQPRQLQFGFRVTY